MMKRSPIVKWFTYFPEPEPERWAGLYEGGGSLVKYYLRLRRSGRDPPCFHSGPHLPPSMEWVSKLPHHPDQYTLPDITSDSVISGHRSQSREYTTQCPLDTLPCVCVPISPLCWHDLHQPPYLTSPRPAAASLKMVAATAAPALLLLGLSSLAAGQWDPSPLMEGRIIILPSTQPSRPSR